MTDKPGSAEDTIEMDDTCSPQFVQEVNRIKSQIKSLVEENHTRKFFRPLTSNIGDETAILRIQFNNMMSKMEEKEKQSLVKELIKMVHHVAEKNSPDRVFVGTNYERVVDQLLRYAHQKGAISTNLCAEGLIMTSDFRLCSRICQEKWKFINDCIPKIDYKGIRNILRYILESQLRRLPYSLSPEQVNEIRIVENVILHIVDRDSNLMPPLITLSEIMRGMPKQALMLPRLTEKLASLSVHFRPIADLSHVCGRGFVYPIPLHPSFYPLTSCWEEHGLNASNTIVQPHHTLPYRPEHTSTYLYTLYMILRQPLGKDSLHPPSKTKTKTNWEMLISVMICESMAEAESLPETEPIPRYQWDNIVNIVIYGITQHLLVPKTFFNVLKNLIKRCKYTRARDEVMWIVFQVVGSLSNLTRLDDAVTEIVELYNELFDGDVVWMGASDHPALFARFLAAAGTWMILEKDFADKMPPANETIKSHIKFIQDGVDNFDSSNTAMLAVLSNIYRTDTKMGKLIVPTLQQMLESIDDTKSLFELSYKRMAVNCFSAFPVEFMEALTFRSKKTLLIQCFQPLRSFSTVRLPSPAVFETVAKICESEDYEMAVKDMEHLAQRSLHVATAADRSSGEHQNVQAKDQCYFLFDFLVYRLPHLHAYSKYSSTVNALSYFTQHIPNNPQNHQIYRLMEQFLMRRWCWAGFHGCITAHTQMFGTSYKDNTMMRHMAYPKTFSVPDQYPFAINPEIFKMAIYSFLRAVKITAQDIAIEKTMFPTIINGFGWPEKSTSYFPKWALDAIKASDTSNAVNTEEILSDVRNTARMHTSLTPNQFVIRYGEDRDPATSHCMLAVLFHFAYNSVDSTYNITSEFYEVMEKKTPKEIVVMGNYLVDYIIADAKTQDCNEKTFKNIAKAAALLVFQFQVLRADRLLLSLIMHPATDEDALICIQIANEFILTPEFQERIRWYHQNVPKKDHFPTEYIKAIVKYHDAFPEFEACELVRSYDSSSNVHMPTYYGCLIERLLPIMDQYLHVALEQQGYKLNPQILQSVSMLYKFHAMPIHFMYSVLFTSHGLMSGPDAKSFVLAFATQIEECHLTEAFEKFNHQKSSREQLIMELIDRMSASLDFILTPPPFVAKDWKIAELSPGAQTLYLACIELMASPHSPETLVAAMINVMQMKPHARPFNIVNLTALLLTALPAAYSNALHDEFVAVFVNGETANLKFEEIVFDNYEESLLLNLPNRARTINVISQQYWLHCSLSLLNFFSHEYVPRILEHVKTEKDLWYTLRLVMPYLRRYYENWDTAKQMRSQRENFGPLHIVKLVFQKLGSMAEEGVEIVYEQHLCDLFYNCKYFFAGDFLRNTAITEFAKLPEKMRDRLKFYVSQSEPTAEQETPPEKEKSPEKEKEQEQEQHVKAHQPLESTPSVSSLPQMQHHLQQAPLLPSHQMMPPPQQHSSSLQHHLQHHTSTHQMMDTSQHQTIQQQSNHPTQQQLQHQIPNMSMHQQMGPQYPGAVFHHPSGPVGHVPMQYGMGHHMQQHPHLPHHQQMPAPMHTMNPMMQNMTPQQQYLYMQQLQQHQQHQQYMQQQQQHHHQHQQQPH
ncbi:Mediator of RNA polymerase II transcription subunit 23 [Caenorhabditis elegans]|uniref:Mediator of RNA polymerase II transcription subunit 23 n=1 Tax=Caenorhabditis elegans TaxID=6239 RepID=MED23_CAEEL|nr:Mediator of RNA polymerase II transcription subunit 23 [Caenorhabditis elegans]Q10669.1 RecName: Full=Mediator of RNA polymerase II transcription subunit 23; AltName: Full=Mediator complex subunit 23; AltName: Full=Mediator complex subunit sur-2 [Caenorhabditis elegans]AAA85507.1 sur-2 [Caenorhabditis elegans]CAB07385.2 Mediator of RNA polymerase II transcription subunit 23 [Caenorhabditis elegans]|eukprot:NP_493575.2 Mediator of RNA polymerase II transcription subunit 23 [Caenorhabditis elegans]